MWPKLQTCLTHLKTNSSNFINTWPNNTNSYFLLLFLSISYLEKFIVVCTVLSQLRPAFNVLSQYYTFADVIAYMICFICKSIRIKVSAKSINVRCPKCLACRYHKVFVKKLWGPIKSSFIPCDINLKVKLGLGTDRH